MEKIGEIYRKMRKDGVLHLARIRFGISNARTRLYNGFKYFCGENAQWLPEYEEVAKWMTDNEGLGLMLIGSNGRGKSVIATKILPLLFREQGYYYAICHANEMNERRKELAQSKILCIDDVGVEDIANNYGERINVFMNLMSDVERKDKLIVITTNLNQDEMEQRYSTRTTDRINEVCKVISFNGGSMRK